MRKKYPSDISPEQFNLIRHDLEGLKKKTRPREINLYDVFCAVMYVVKGGIPWRMLPSDFPSWQLVYYYYSLWRKPDEHGVSLLDRILAKLVEKTRVRNGRKPKPTLGIIDSKSIKNTDIPREKGYDAGKKVSGVKLHACVDILGLPLSLHVTTANVTDRNGAVEMARLYPESYETVEAVLVDGGYSGEKFAMTMKTITGATVEVVKRNELHTFVVIPKRWVVERSFGWSDKFRRLWKNCERYLCNTRAMVIVAFIGILLKRY